MSEQNERPCNTHMLNRAPAFPTKFKDLSLGTFFTKTNPSDRDNPCIYVKSRVAHAYGLNDCPESYGMSMSELVYPVQLHFVRARYTEGLPA